VLIGGAGSGLVLDSSGAGLTLNHSKVAGSVTGAGVDNTAGGSVSIAHAIVHGNAGDDLVNVPCSTVVWSDVGTPDCSSMNDNLSADPLLDGAFVPQAGSPVLDHGPDPALFTGEPCHDLSGGPRLRDYDGDGLAPMDPGAFEPADESLLPGEVQNLRWTSDSVLEWDVEPDAAEYHVYRIALSALGYGSFAVCRDDLDAIRTDTQLVDVELPVSGTANAYQITAEGAGGAEGTLGNGACAERSNYTPCP